MDSTLDWTHPEDILPFDFLESFVSSANSLVNSPSGSSSIAVKTRWEIKNHADVRVNLLLVNNDLRGRYPHVSVLKNLVCPGICCYGLFETKSLVNILLHLTRSTPLKQALMARNR